MQLLSVGGMPFVLFCKPLCQKCVCILHFSRLNQAASFVEQTLLQPAN